MDLVERVVEDETRRLFGLSTKYAVLAQPHSATQANQAVFHAVRQGGKLRVCALALRDGGHVSHHRGLPPGSMVHPLVIDDNGLDVQAASALCEHVRPDLIVVGASSFPKALDLRPMRGVADRCGAWLHADLAHCGLFVAAGLHPPVFPAADSATIDLGKLFRGPRGAVLVVRNPSAGSVADALFPRVQSSPNQTALFAKAVALLANDDVYVRDYAGRLLAASRAMVDGFREAGVDIAFGGSESHLLLLDLRRAGVSGAAVESRLEGRRILANRNLTPGDPRSYRDTSGLRLSVATLATLGYRSEDVTSITREIVAAIRDEPSPGHVSDLLARYHGGLVSIANAPN